jgi:hypothetical protein
LSEAKGLDQLPLSVLKGERDGIDTGNRQIAPRRKAAQQQGTARSRCRANQFVVEVYS